jgi:hypothetical protein
MAKGKAKGITRKPKVDFEKVSISFEKMLSKEETKEEIVMTPSEIDLAAGNEYLSIVCKTGTRTIPPPIPVSGETIPENNPLIDRRPHRNLPASCTESPILPDLIFQNSLNII